MSDATLNPATADLAKAYTPGDVERQWLSRWLAAQCFRGDETSTAPAYSIVIPPPNVTGVLHLGHVLNNTLQDILARRARMKGHAVLWLPGTDHAGIATQSVVERKLRQEEKLTRRDLGREKFLERVWAWKEKHGGIIIEQLKRLGCSCDWSRERFTMDEGYAPRVQQTFVDLHQKGLIYRGKRMVNWCPKSLTALSDEEVIMKHQRGKLYTMKYELVAQPGQFLEIATTRPETLMADVAVAVNPKDERYAHLIGQQVYRPFPKEAIPIIGDDYVTFDFGTGVLKVTPAHDRADYEIGLRHQLPIIDCLTPDGHIDCPAVTELHGLERFEARKKAAAMLADLGQLAKEEDYENNVGFSERADVPIEPRLSLQWFLRYPQVAEAAAAVRDGHITFRPERWTKTYLNWLDGIQDWCVSRQLWWGHRIPAWYKNKDTAEEEIRVQLDSPGPEWTQEDDVLDTWFSSWLWPFATMDNATLAKFYPTTDLVTGPDIIFFWVARMIMAGLEYEGRIPFKNVFFTSIIRDRQGRKMSKSLGNSPDPLDLIEKYGADGLRFGLLRIAPTGTDVKFDEAQVEEGRNFANKLWNACRFRLMQGPAGPGTTTPSLDQLSPFAIDILARLDRLSIDLDAALADYEFSTATQLIYEFFWSNYCDLYLETIKGDTSAGTLATQDIVLRRLLMQLHPFMPHVTEELWQLLGFGQKDDFLMLTVLDAQPVLPADPAHQEKITTARQQAATVYEAAARTRHLKAEYQLGAKRGINFHLRPASPDTAALIPVFKLLIGAGEITLDPAYTAPTGTPVTSTPLGDLYMPLDGLIDVAAEKSRLTKELAKVQAEVDKATAKLANPTFADRAPADVVAAAHQTLADWKTKLAKIDAQLQALG
jgi:valyl-tRNA synthetase